MNTVESILKKYRIDEKTLKNGAKRIHESAGNVKLGVVINENSIVGSLTNSNGVELYSINEKNVGNDVVTHKLSEILEFYNKTAQIVKEDDEDDDEKEILLDDENNPIEEPDDFTDDTAAEQEEIPEEEPVGADIEHLGASIKDLNLLKQRILDLAKDATSIVNKFDDTDAENKSIAIGLAASLYDIAQNVNEFTDDVIDKVEDTVKENVHYNKSERINAVRLSKGRISEAIINLCKFKQYTNLVESLKDIRSELTVSK